jgi:hypothetical protein
MLLGVRMIFSSGRIVGAVGEENPTPIAVGCHALFACRNIPPASHYIPVRHRKMLKISAVFVILRIGT